MKQDKEGKASHGYRSEVGNQPYANQGAKEEGPAGGGDEFEAGDRGDLSGRNLDQQARAAGVPDGAPSDDVEQHQQQHDRQRDTQQPEDERHL